ncbi:SAM-dependent methyltransferase [Luteolibacter sp. SL250]|uniref:SAM-dependent methyltransferase n=1 Tax=Luteolibacter sp. SL250 TaxID=2995170 RepID=UPI00226F4D05|nr:SAM-dependent methyltransferase [Luteolibacter sp. SL250]WAC17979.1 SAM-dependent methyltransferase [Luteolibacter sp. SL250]
MSGNQPLIRFDRFMDRALHDPETGYYARRITGVGRGGDFTTAPTLSKATGKAVAAWAAAAMKECGSFDLIEIGPGEGKLAAAMLEHLPWFTRLRTKLHLVETSRPLAEIQRKLLGNRATWYRTPAEALQACGGKAVIFSNELVDAFPLRCFQKTESDWKELAVRLGPPVEEVLLDVDALPSSSSFAVGHPVGQRIEVHESYQHWLAGWMPLWKAGRMLTIDYGAEAGDLYHRRPRGCLRAYLLQQRLEGLAIYGNPGRQDLTADVNFTDLRDWGREWSKNTTLRTFGEFLGPFLDPSKPADAYLADPSGPGGAFLVLDQGK